jgi:hypothetical protein
MARSARVQLNVRSTFARERARELAKLTGMTATQVVEEALRAYSPPGGASAPGRLVRRGPILVRPSNGETISLADAEAALNDVRRRDLAD